MNELGWIKLHRKIINNPIMLNAELLQIFVYCLLRANYEDAEIIFNGKLESVKRGSFITGRKIMAEKLNQSESGLYKRLQLLDTLGYIKIKSNNKFSVITIVNYSTYQLPESPEEQQSNNKVTTKEQQSNTDKNIKEYKEEKERNTLFKNSEYYDYEKFKERFYSNPDYQKYDAKYYYESALNWSEANNKKKANWIATVYNWCRRDVTDGKPHLFKPESVKLR